MVRFRNDRSLSPEQIELIVRWVGSGIRRGSNPNQLPPTPPVARPERFHVAANVVSVRGDGRVDVNVLVDGLFVEPSTSPTSARIWATLPTGASVPLVRLHDYDAAFAHPFLLQNLRSLPAGTRIRGLPHGATLILIPAARN